MAKKIMKVGIMSKDDYIKRTIAIAKGEIKPKSNDPKVWFESLKSLSQVLGSENQDLLKTIVKHKPRSISELEQMTNRRKSNLSRTLKTLAKYGIVALPKKEGKIIPKVLATDFQVQFGLTYSKPTLADNHSA